jgi:endogenous inhibitor of DNA gyrase (YacG/DUF329 family)
MADGRKCPACGETVALTLTESTQGKGMIREVWHCNICQKTFLQWVELRHKPFSAE